MDDDLKEKLLDAIERVLFAHDMLDMGAECSCGARNNMDGDVLHAHRMGAFDDALEAVFRRGENQE